MSLAMTGVVEMTDTVFLCSTAVVDLMQQVGVGECGKGAEKGRAVNSGQCLYQVLQVESVMELVAHMVFPKSGRSFMLYSLSRDLSLTLCSKGGKGWNIQYD